MGASLEIVLLDESGKRVEGGPESSSMIQIDVLDGDFDVEVKNDWTVKEHKEYVAMPRKDRGSLLKDNRIISLSRGVASVCSISFTDNSRAVVKNGMFRLGARIKEGLPYGEFVRSAVSKKFKVMEVRGKDSEKHPVPSLHDPIWRLKNIREPGKYFSRAKDNNVHTVKDFLQLYNTDEKKMRKILGGIPETQWDETVKNARACKLTPKRLRYYDDASGDDLLLDCAFNIIAMGEKTYESLGLKQKEKADKLRQAAYEKRDELEIIDDPTNQVPAGPAYPSDIQQQEQGEQEQQPVTSLPPSMDPSVGGLREYLDASLSSDKIGSNAHMLYPDTTAADQDCLLQNTLLSKSVCLTTEDSGEQTVKLSQAAYERQDELENFDESTNLQAGLTYPYSVQQQVQGEQEQNQAPTLPPSVSYNPTIMQYTDTIAADQECLWQSTGNTTLMGLMTDASEYIQVNNPSHGNETWNVNDIFYETGSPGFYRSISMMLRSSQGETEVQQECSYSSSSNVQAFPSLFSENGAFHKGTQLHIIRIS